MVTSIAPLKIVEHTLDKKNSATEEIEVAAGEVMPQGQQITGAKVESTAAELTEEKPAEEVTPPSKQKPNENQAYLLSALGGLVKALFLATIFGARRSLRYLIHHPLHILFDLALIALLSLVVYTGIEINNQLILDRISDKAVNEIISASRFGRNYNAEDLERVGVRELVGVGAPEWMQRESVRAILYHARKAGLAVEDQAVLLAIVDIESGFNPLARAPTTSACGLFQFVRRTGDLFNLTTDRCMDPWENARAGVEHYLFNYERRVQPLVTDLVGTERVFRVFQLSYYFHHDGIASSNPTNDVKGTILEGTQFLFRAYHVLQEEAQMPDRAPDFAEKFTTNFQRVTTAIKEFITTTALYRYLFASPSTTQEFGE
jgi:hypothetical protein